MKKKLALGLALILACGTLAGCGGSSDSSEGSSEGSGDGSVTAKVIDIDLTSEEYAFGVDKNQPELLDQVNGFIAKIQEDGTFDEICDKYFGGGEPEAVESAELDSSKDQLVVATNAAFEPFEYTKGDQYYGIDMEIAALLAEELGQELVIQNMDFDAVCLSVGQQKCDIAMAGLTINEEREEYDDSAFDDCEDADAVAAKLGELESSDKIGVQQGTTGQYYVEGDEEWGFDGLPAECVPYKSGSLAVQDLLNGNIQYVIIDAAPAAAITEAINEMQ